VQPVPPPAPQIPQAQLEGCQLLSDRIEMLRRLPQGGIVAEKLQDYLLIFYSIWHQQYE
jgi:hypothetical protein